MSISKSSTKPILNAIADKSPEIIKYAAPPSKEDSKSKGNIQKEAIQMNRERIAELARKKQASVGYSNMVISTNDNKPSPLKVTTEAINVKEKPKEIIPQSEASIISPQKTTELSKLDQGSFQKKQMPTISRSSQQTEVCFN
jgi:hypothetical protein